MGTSIQIYDRCRQDLFDDQTRGVGEPLQLVKVDGCFNINFNGLIFIH